MMLGIWQTRGVRCCWKPSAGMATTVAYGVQMQNHSSTFVMATWQYTSLHYISVIQVVMIVV